MGVTQIWTTFPLADNRVGRVLIEWKSSIGWRSLEPQSRTALGVEHIPECRLSPGVNIHFMFLQAL